jgi:hypothetical protein
MENKIWRNLNCHLSISTPMYMNFIYKMVFTQEHKRFVTESYFQNGNEEIGHWVCHTFNIAVSTIGNYAHFHKFYFPCSYLFFC